jgi:hypothetical protein
VIAINPPSAMVYPKTRQHVKTENPVNKTTGSINILIPDSLMVAKN